MEYWTDRQTDVFSKIPIHNLTKTDFMHVHIMFVWHSARICTCTYERILEHLGVNL